MSYYPTQEDLNLLFQGQKNIFVKAELLNLDFMTEESFEGTLISDSFKIDSTSQIRRTYQCQIHVADPSYLIGRDKKFWFDKYIRPYVGYYSLRKKEIVWYLKGTFALVNASQVYDMEHTISLECSDLMCMLTGERNGFQPAKEFSIPAGENIRTAVIGLIAAFGFVRYRIDPTDRTVPYDLNFGAGTDTCSMISELMQFWPNYEWFFDLDGTFVIQRIPCYTNDMDIIDDHVFSRLVVDESLSVDFSACNCIEVWGKEFDSKGLDGFTEQCTYSDNTYHASFEGLKELKDYMVLGIKVPDTNQAGFSLSIAGIGTYPVRDDYERPMEAGILEKDITYLFLYRSETFYYLGTFSIHAIFKNEHPDSPFSVKNMGKEVWMVCSDGEYLNITSDLLACERAVYECYYKSHLNDALTLTAVDIPWLDVNQKVSYTPKSTGETNRYMITSVSSDTLSGTCSLTLTRFYPDWSEVLNQLHIKTTKGR